VSERSYEVGIWEEFDGFFILKDGIIEVALSGTNSCKRRDGSVVIGKRSQCVSIILLRFLVLAHYKQRVAERPSVKCDQFPRWRFGIDCLCDCARKMFFRVFQTAVKRREFGASNLHTGYALRAVIGTLLHFTMSLFGLIVIAEFDQRIFQLLVC